MHFLLAFRARKRVLPSTKFVELRQNTYERNRRVFVAYKTPTVNAISKNIIISDTDENFVFLVTNFAYYGTAFSTNNATNKMKRPFVHTFGINAPFDKHNFPMVGNNSFR